MFLESSDADVAMTGLVFRCHLSQSADGDFSISFHLFKTSDSGNPVLIHHQQAPF